MLVNQTIAIHGKKVKRMRKDVARRRYDQGQRIFLLASNCIYGSYWFGSGCPVDNSDDRTFDAQVNEFEYYNCDNERGYYACYYVNA